MPAEPSVAGGSDAERLRAAWSHAVRTLGGEPSPQDTEDLLARWSQPHRRYHDLAHAAAVVAAVRRLAVPAGLSARGEAVALLAAAAHDVVHDGRPGQDEEASAQWLEAVGSRSGVPATDVRQAAAAVRATAGHAGVDPPRPDRLTAVVLDADLDVLAGSATQYEAYVARVRGEYAGVPDEDWRRGRGEVLRGLLRRDRLFLLAEGDPGREAVARANLRQELAALDGPPDR